MSLNCIAYAHHYVPTGHGDQLRCIWCDQHSPSFAQGYADGLAKKEAAENANEIALDIQNRSVAGYDPLDIIT